MLVAQAIGNRTIGRDAIGNGESQKDLGPVDGAPGQERVSMRRTSW